MKHMNTKKKKLRIITVLSVIILAFLVLLICRLVQTEKERVVLQKANIVNLYGKAKLNIRFFNTTGAFNNAKNIVFLSGLGNSDSCVALRPLSTLLSKEHNVALVDRPGYGVSFDSKIKQSADVIIENYRDALLDAGYKSPYCLLAHSISGMYALYWQYKYPEEIESIVFIDSTSPELYVEEAMGKKTPGKANAILKKVLVSLGLARIRPLYEKFAGKIENYNQLYSEEEMNLRWLLFMQKPYSNAFMSEDIYKYENARIINSVCSESAAPKLYLSSQRWTGLYYENYFKAKALENFGGKEDVLENYAKKAILNKSMADEKMTRFGNIEFVNIPGPHALYEYSPEKMATEIIRFLK